MCRSRMEETMHASSQGQGRPSSQHERENEKLALDIEEAGRESTRVRVTDERTEERRVQCIASPRSAEDKMSRRPAIALSRSLSSSSMFGSSAAGSSAGPPRPREGGTTRVEQPREEASIGPLGY